MTKQNAIAIKAITLLSYINILDIYIYYAK